MLNFLSLLIKEIIEILYTLTGCGFFIKKKKIKNYDEHVALQFQQHGFKDMLFIRMRISKCSL